MRNLKKVLALVVAVAMLASMGLVASAATYTDVASNASYADAVNLLSNLGIITGYEDGTFKPDNTVTRAEAATMIVRMLGLAEDVEQGETMFTDVAADNWASGYVNVAVANGIVNGMGDGTFAPNGEVTYGQIVKMIVCALGYEPVANNNGGWLGGGYLVAGSKAGFTKGVSGTQDGAASRATVAQLIYKALEVELMDQTSYSTGLAGDTFEVLEGQTILSEYLEIEKVEGVVTETYLSNVDEYEEDANTATIVITKTFADESELELGEEFVGVCETENIAGLLGYSVVAYVGENADEDLEIFAVAEKAGKNKTLVLDVEDIEELDADYIKYWKSSKSTTEADIEAFIEIGRDEEVEVENNQVVNGFNVYEDAEDIFEAYEELEEITFLDNDGDGNFEFVFATIPSENAVEFVIEEVEAEDEYYSFASEENESFEVDYEAEDVLYTIVKDGIIVDASEIAEGDVITVLDDSLAIVTVYVSSVVVDGVVDEVEEDTYYTIANNEYKLSTLSEVEAPDAGDEGKFYINAFGKIAYVDAVSSSAAADYVYVIAADVSEGDFGDDAYLVKVVTAEGEVEVLTIKAKKCIVDGEKDQTDEDVYEAIGDYVGLAKIDTTAAGELSAIYFPAEEGEFVADDSYAEENEDEYNKARGRYDTMRLSSVELVFHIDTTEEDLEDGVTVTTLENLFVDENSYTFTAYGEEDEEPVVLVVTDAMTAVNTEAPVMVVTKVSTVDVEDDETVKITGIVAGETVTVIADPDDALTEEDFAKGDIILYAVNAGYATDVQVLYNEDGIAAELEDILVDELSEEFVTIHYGAISEVEKDSFFVGEDEFFFGDDVNVTVIDNTGAKMSVEKGTKSSVKEDTVRTDYTLVRTAFVKTELESDDIVTDIVVFVERVDN